MIKTFNLKLIVFIIVCLYSTILSAQINSTTAVVPFGANPSYQSGIMPTNLPTSGTYGKSQDAANAYNTWKSSYAVACGSGYRVKFDDPTVTVSEGIGYGMLLAAYAADKAFFDGLWTYYKANSNGNGLMNWRIAGCSGVTGSNGATDADLDVAYALLVANNQWPTATSPFTYLTEANTQIAHIKNTEVNSSTNYQAINGDGWGYGNSCRNPSYQAPAYYKEFYKLGNDGNWNNAVTSAYSLINKNVNATTGLVSDWCDQNGTPNTCNGSPNGQTTLGFGYDASRNPWRMAQDVIWNNETNAKTICTNLAAYIAGQGASNVKAPLYQTGGLYSGNVHNATFVSMFATAVMGSSNQTLMNQMYSETVLIQDQIQNQSLSGYFGNTLRCVSLFMMSGNFWKIGTTSKPNLTVLAGTALTPVPTTTIYDFQNVISTGSSITTFTAKNLGFQTLTFSGSPIVSISGTDASYFTIVQTGLAASLASNAISTFTIKFTPGGAIGTKTATISIASNDPNQNPYTFTVTGTGTLNATAPKISVAAGATTIASNGTYAMGTSSTGSNNIYGFTVSNSGTAPLNLTASTATGTGYSVIPPLVGGSIAVGATDTVWVQVTSATVGTPTGSVTINSNDPNFPAYKVNLTANVVACGTAITSNNIYQDYDANYGNSTLDYPNTAWTEKFANPSIDAVNPSANVAKFVRPATGTYVGVRYGLCSTTNFVTLTSSLYDIAVLVYSPVAGVPVTMNLKTDADVANTTTYPSTSSVTVTTTLVNQWEVLYFNHAGAIGKTGIRHIELDIDPLAAKGVQTYYVDKFQLVQAPCVTDLPTSNVLQDFDAHRNVSLSYPVTQYTEEFANPVASGINTSAFVGRFVKNTGVVAYTDAFRYLGCGNVLTIPAAKPFISMMVYAPAAGASIQLNINTGIGTGLTALTPSITTKTVYANQWQKIYFDLSSIASRTDLTSFDVFIDPTNAGANGATYYVDNIQFDVNPCAGFAASNVMDDFDNNRFLNLVNATGTYNDVAANPSKTGINTSTTVAQYGRPATGTYANFILQPCSKQFDLSLGRAVYTMQVYSPKANVPVVIGLKTGTVAGPTATDLIQASDTIRAANTWQTLTFDFSDSISSTNGNFMYVYIDPLAANGATTYYVDNIQYAGPAPIISVKQGSTPYKNGSTYTFATPVAIGAAGLPISFTIQNNGLQSLNLNSIKISNPEFAIDTTQTVRPVGAASSTGFTITFTPVAGGTRTGTLTILNNDPLKNPYKVYLSATASSPIISVFNGTTAVANNNVTAVSLGSAPVGTAAPVFTFTIKNTGAAALTITSVTGASASVFAVSPAITPTGPIAATTGTATFTVTATPAVAGVTSGTIVIKSNDPTTPTYTINVSVTGTVPVISVKDKNLVTVANNNPTAIDLGSAPVNTAGTAYTFTIANTGLAPLSITSVTGAPTVFAALAITPTGPVAATSGTATFTVTATPTVAGVTTGTIVIKSTDPATPTYTINVSITGTVPVIGIKDATPATVQNNNAPAILVGTAAVGSAATPYTFTITNTGLAPLKNIVVSTISAGFILSIPTATTIAAGATATFTVTATPATAGTANAGVITIASSDAVTPSYKVNVTATGTVPALTVKNGTTIVTSPTTAISVGSATVGSPATAYTSFTVNNTGLAPLTLTSINVTTGGSIFKLTGLPTPMPGPIPAGGSATFTVTGTPSAVGSNPGTITITTNDPATPSFLLNVDVTGQAASTPSLQVKNGAAIITSSSTAVLVGTAPIGTAAPAFTSFTINNNGTAALSFNSISVTTGTAVFSLSNIPTSFPVTIPVGGNVTFTVTATPANAGANAGVITIGTNDPATPSFILNVTATGTVPQLQVFDGAIQITPPNTAILIGTAQTGSITTPAYTTLSIKNNGGAALSITSIVASSGFTLVTSPATVTTIAPNGTVTFNVTATPATVGTNNTGTITIKSSDPTTGTFVINVTATGTLAPQALVVKNGTTVLTTGATPAINVGTAVKGSPAPANTSITITNTGGAVLNIASITGSAGYAVTPGGASTVAAGASLTLNVIATPATIGSSNGGTITIASNDPTTASFVINVTSTGTSAPTPALVVKDGVTTVNTNSTAILVGTSAVGSAATPYTFTITNNGTAVLNVSSITSGSTVFVLDVSTVPATVAVGASATFTVTATPTVVGTSNTGIITILTDDPTTTSFKLNVTATGTPAAAPQLQVYNNTTLVGTNNTAISLGTSVKNTPGTPYAGFSIKNNGNAPLTLNSITGTSVYVISPTLAFPVTIAAGASQAFTVTGTPTVVGTNTNPATIVISTNDPTTGTFNLKVNMDATSTPVAQLQVLNNLTQVSPNNTPDISLGTSVVNTAGTAYTGFSVKNNGSAPLTLNNISSGSAVYVISPIAVPVTLAAGASQLFTVTGTPTVVGTNTNPGTITISTDDPTTPSFALKVNMSATKAPVPPTITIPGITNGGTSDLGQAVEGNSTAPKTYTITNTGTTPLRIEAIDVTGDFSVPTKMPLTIAPGDIGTFTVIGTPTAVGLSSGTVTIISNDPDATATGGFVINVTSTGTDKPVGPAIQVMDATGTVLVNNGAIIAIGSNASGVATSPYFFTVKNIGSSTLTITQVSAQSGFTGLKPSPATIAPGATAIIKVGGKPDPSTGPTTIGYVAIVSDDVNTANQLFTINVSVSVGTPTGLTKTLANTAIELYPNPSNGNANLEFNGAFDDVSIVVYKADGGHVYNESLSSVNGLTKQLQLEELPAGVYFVEVNTAQGKIVKRLVKQQ